MYRYSTSQLAVITAVPTVTVLLIWTLAIFFKNKKQWRPFDLCIVAILIQSILRNLSTLSYTMLTIIGQTTDISNNYCTVLIWLFNSLHTYQATTLSTLSVVGFYIIVMRKKHKETTSYLTATHIAYHLFCLTTLCACVGVAAILAQNSMRTHKSANFELNYARNSTYAMDSCHFMPYHLDIRYNVFILSLHTLLTIISISCFIGIVVVFYKKKSIEFDHLKKSTSDLSDLSLGAAASTVSRKDEINAKNYYDTYQKQQDNVYIRENRSEYTTTASKSEPWNSDTSNISTSVSSTNSRRPCLQQKKSKCDRSTGLETILPVLIVCYLFNHLPVLVVCVFPWLLTPWISGAGAALWLGLAQDALVPTALGLADSRFNSWVSAAYRCTRSSKKRQQDKPPHGLDGKFRPFTSSPQAPPVISQARTRPIVPQPLQITTHDHKFPITNGSLYTSIEGRLPIIHNYRRHKGLRNPVHSISMGLHSTYIKRQESLNNQPQIAQHYQQPEPCDDSFISLPVDYTSIESNFTDMKPNRNHIISQICLSNNSDLKPPRGVFSASQNSLNDVSIIENELRKIRTNNMSKSQSNLNEINVIQRDIQKFRRNPEVYQKQIQTATNLSEKDVESSDDEYFTHSINFNDKNYDTISSKSCCSITTEANCDFEFYGQQTTESKSPFSSFHRKTNDDHQKTGDNYIMKLNSNNNTQTNRPYPVMRSFKPLMCKTVDDMSNSENILNKTNYNSPRNEMEVTRNYRIRRSNSKRSLENLDIYVKDKDYKVQRSNSNRSCDLLRTNINNKGTYIIRTNSNRSYEVMRSNPNISETNLVHRKPSVTRLNYKNLNTSCIHFNEKNEAYNRNFNRDKDKITKQKTSTPVLSMESLSSVLNRQEVSYLDNGDICNHNYGGSVPDFKKIFVSEFI